MAQDKTTYLLDRLSGGEAQAAETLLPLVYAELRTLAGRYLRCQPSDHTLQPTALVHEAFIRLVGDVPANWSGRRHFFRIAAKAMRRILIDHARQRCAAKRGGGRLKLALEDVLEPVCAADESDESTLALDDALTRLTELDEQLVQLVELRYFAGFSIEETAEVLAISPTSVKRLWRIARGWLGRELAED